MTVIVLGLSIASLILLAIGLIGLYGFFVLKDIEGGIFSIVALGLLFYIYVVHWDSVINALRLALK